MQKLGRPSAEQLDVVRWVVAAAMAVVFILTGFEPALILGVVVFSLPALSRMTKSFREGSRGPD